MLTSKHKSSIILGLDPGIERIGWGVLFLNQKKIIKTSWGRITTPRHTPLDKRLAIIAQKTRQLIARIRPTCVSIEKIFFAKNVKTAIDVAHARGALLLVAQERNIPIVEYTPLQVKQALTGYGRADKRQIHFMIEQLFRIRIPRSQDDAADALAIAYTAFVNTRKIINLKS